MHARIAGLLGALLMLAACSSTPPEPPPPGPPGPPGGAGIGSRNIVPGSQQDLEASAGDRVFFAFDRADISPEAREILGRQADWLRRYPNVTVTIEGRCDVRGTCEYNLALGERRAQAAKNVLVASGIPASRRQLSVRRRRVGENSKKRGRCDSIHGSSCCLMRPFFALKGP